MDLTKGSGMAAASSITSSSACPSCAWCWGWMYCTVCRQASTPLKESVIDRGVSRLLEVKTCREQQSATHRLPQQQQKLNCGCMSYYAAHLLVAAEQGDADTQPSKRRQAASSTTLQCFLLPLCIAAHQPLTKQPAV